MDEIVSFGDQFMIKPEKSRIEMDDLAAVIRDSIAAQKNDDNRAPFSAPVAVTAPSSIPELKLQPDFQTRSNNRYHIGDLLRYHDRVFVDSAYRAILKRPADATESARDLKRLRSGDFNKIDLLAALRYSNEGRAKGVEVDGLSLPAMVRRLGQLPLIGYFVRLGIALARLPNQVRDQREFAGYVLAQNQQIADFINAISARVAESNEGISRVQATLDALRDEHRAQRAALDQTIDTHNAELNHRIDLLHTQVNPMADHQLDGLYAALEERFRGSRDEIKNRLRVYLPYVETARDSVVIDLGPGRGEWLELLKEAAINARGVEKNRVSIEQCRARGLEVVEDDVMAHLRTLADSSAGGVTGFHIIEHVSIDAVVSLLDEVRRVLRPGGVAIFETPNPDNVLVGTNFFYLDPTHHHPLPSELMQFLFESRGFRRIEVLNLHPWDSGRVAGEGELAERFNGYFFGPMDYAILGWKAEGNDK